MPTRRKSVSDGKRARALDMHLAGATYQAIADAVGYANAGSAHTAVKAALSGLGQPAAWGDTIRVELQRMDAMLLGLWDKAQVGDTAAIDRVLRISERRTALMGLANGGVNEGERKTALDELSARREAAGRPNATHNTGP